ncbi:MAG: peptidylprolyl isomerase [Fusobacteriota bacterium]
MISCTIFNKKTEKKEVSKVNNLEAVIKTEKGNINLKLYSDIAPITVSNFINLAKRGYYDNLNFHRVISDFMIQGGCPDGTGRGGPGYKFEDEFSNEVKFDEPGKLAMANSGPETNGSQFFITHVPTSWLQGKHTIFGEVVSDDDQKIVDSIEVGDKIETIEIKGDYEKLINNYSNRIKKWNDILDNN